MTAFFDRTAELREEGRDPTKTPEALAKVASTQRERVAARRRWEESYGPDKTPDPEFFREHILPVLQAFAAKGGPWL